MNKQEALAHALEEIRKLPKAEIKHDGIFRPEYKSRGFEEIGYYIPSDYLPYRP